MDKQGRITAWREWRLGSLYLFKKGDFIRNAGTLIETNYKDGYVKFATNMFPDGLTVYAWGNRYIDVSDWMDSVSLGRELYGRGWGSQIGVFGARFTSERSLQDAVYQHKNASRGLRYSGANVTHNCGNCVFYDAPFERCGLSVNSQFTEISPDKWCQYWQGKEHRNWRRN